MGGIIRDVETWRQIRTHIQNALRVDHEVHHEVHHEGLTASALAPVNHEVDRAPALAPNDHDHEGITPAALARFRAEAATEELTAAALAPVDHEVHPANTRFRVDWG